jgi:hypothetical protein
MNRLHNNPIPFSDDAIRAFLLGRLDAADQTKFEEQLIADDDLETRVRRGEFRLADDFVSERIDPVDNRRFERNFLLTGERRRQLMVSTALRDRLSPSHAAESPRLSARWHQFFTFNRATWRFAFAVAIALFLIASFWLVTKEPQLVRKLLPRRVPSRPAAVSTPQEVHHPRDSAPPVHQDTATPPPAHESTLQNSATIVTTVSLSPGNPGDMGQAATTSLPSDLNGVVRLQLAVERNSSEEFRAELFSDSNQSVFVADSLKKAGDSDRLVFDVPVRVLKAGDYQVQLSRLHDGSKQAVANYYFRVR